MQELSQELREFFHIVAAPLFPPEGAVIPGELLAVPEDRQAADSASRGREGAHTLNGEKAPI